MSKDNFIYSYKNSFSAGELSPLMDGRTDLAQYQHGAKVLKNFCNMPSGGVMRRPGTKFVDILSSDVAKLESVATGIIKHPEYKLKQSLPKCLASLILMRGLGYIVIFEIDKDNNRTNISYIAVNNASNGVRIPCIISEEKTYLDFAFKPKDFSYILDQGRLYITFGSSYPVYIVEQNLAYVRETEGMELSDILLAKQQTALIIKPHDVVNSKTYADDVLDNTTPVPLSYDQIVARGELSEMSEYNAHLRNASGTGKPITKLRCNVLATYNSRLWGLGMPKNIHGVLASYCGDYSNFNTAYVHLGEARNPLSAMFVIFQSQGLDEILWAIPFSKELIIATTSGIYVLSEGDRVKGEYVRIYKEMDIGVSSINPVMINKTIFFVGSDNKTIYSLYYSREKGGYQVNHVNVHSSHIFTSGIKTIVGVSSPFSMLVAVLKDGSFALFIYDQELKLMGWSQHFLGGNGFVEDAIVLPKEKGDEIYFRVTRDAYNIGDDGDAQVNAGAVDHTKKDYLESLDCSLLTSSITTTPHEVVYIDCYKHIYRKEDIEIDKVFKDILKEGRELTEQEDMLHQEFHRRSIELSDEYIEQNFYVNGTKFSELMTDNPIFSLYSPILGRALAQKEALRKLIKDYFGGLNIIAYDALGLLYLSYKLTTQGIGYCIAYALGKETYKEKIEEILDDLKKLKVDALALADEFSQYNLPDVIKDDIKFYYNNGAKEYYSSIRFVSLKDSDMEFNFNVFGEMFYVNAPSFDIPARRLNYMFELAKKHLLSPKKALIDFDEKVAKEIMATLNRKFLSTQALPITDIKELYENTNSNSWLQRLLEDFNYAQFNVEFNINTLFNNLLKRRVIGQFDNQKLDLEGAKNFVDSTLPKIINELLFHYCSNSSKTLHRISPKIQELFKSTLIYYDVLQNPNDLEEILKHINDNYLDRNCEFLINFEDSLINKVSRLFNPDEQDDMSLNEGEGEIQAIDGEEEEQIVFNPDEQEEDIQDIGDEKTQEDIFLEWYIELIDSSKTLDQMKIAIKNDAKILRLKEPKDNTHALFAMFTNSKSTAEYLNKLREGISILYHSILPIRVRYSLRAEMFTDAKERQLNMCLFYSKNYFRYFRKLFPDIDMETIKTLVKMSEPPMNFADPSKEGFNYIEGHEIVVLADEEIVYNANYDNKLKDQKIPLNIPAYFVSVGFKYSSHLSTFPFQFQDEYEHVLKSDFVFGIKVYNTRGGTIKHKDHEGVERKYTISAPKYDVKSLDYYHTEKKYLIKETVDAIRTPYITGWVDIEVDSKVDKDISLIFHVEDPVPATILKVYTKAKTLPGYY